LHFFFNVGVEGGQLLFIASVIAVMAIWRRIARHIDAVPVAWAWRVPVRHRQRRIVRLIQRIVASGCGSVAIQCVSTGADAGAAKQD
jgi:hypothetical protein